MATEPTPDPKDSPADETTPDPATDREPAIETADSPADDTNEDPLDELEVIETVEEINATATTDPALDQTQPPTAEDAVEFDTDAARLAIQQAAWDAREQAEFEESVADRLTKASGEASWPRRIAAEFLGTLILVLVGVGIALTLSMTGSTPWMVALGFGIAVMGGSFAFGYISGGHFNPAVTLGAALAGRTRWLNVPVYWIAQVLGGLAATGILKIITLAIEPNLTATAVANLVAQNGAEGASTMITEQLIDPMWDAVSNSTTAGQYTQISLVGAILLEALLTLVFVMIVLGATGPRANRKVAGVAIGLSLAVLIMVAIPFTNGSLNPARSTATAIFTGGESLKQLWLFWAAPLLGGALAGLLYPLLGGFGTGSDDELEAAEADVAYDVAAQTAARVTTP